MLRLVYLFVLLFFLACQNLSKKRINSSDGICNNEESSGLVAGLVWQYNKCHTNPSKGNLLILASFLDGSKISSENIFKELLLIPEKFLCAPGPFFLATNNFKPNDTTYTWILDKQPSYFVCPRKISETINFYLTDQSGMPIKSRVFDLKEGFNNLSVLAPEKPLTEGKNYYLYIKNNDETKWIQPLRIDPQSL